MTHSHWEFDSQCPRCGKMNHASSPVGERVVVVHCEHCAHSYDYVHIVGKHEQVEDSESDS